MQSMKKKISSFLIPAVKKICLKLITEDAFDRRKSILSSVTKSDYVAETENLIKKFQEVSLVDFWKSYVIGNDAPHYKIPYKGLYMSKLPCDMFIYPDIIYRATPEVVVEIGTQRGGSTIFYSDLLAPYGGHVATVDINSPDKEILSLFEEKNISFIEGDINNPETIQAILEYCTGKKCLVIDDGSHNENDVYNTFRSLNHLIPAGGFYIIEDGMTNAILMDVLPDKQDLQPNRAIALILRNYLNFELFRVYDEYVFSTVLMGIIQRKKKDYKP